MRGRNFVGDGSYSAYQNFEVLDCDAHPDNETLDGSDSGSNTYRACPGTVTSESGFKVLSSETVVLHGAAGVVIEEIEIESGATVTMLSD